ncbi:tetratricopeptide repeat protein [Candidatus Uabimicrobium sp. HlEnr_7]|uniref:tetratricopeptide repeat protein n=1 Tax=Candidatus Uabimicrobium helgolandensis TaxID=3095367 RepID=UPI0035566A32
MKTLSVIILLVFVCPLYLEAKIIPFLFTSGGNITSISELPEEVKNMLDVHDNDVLAYAYDYYGLFYINFWTTNGFFCFYNTKSHVYRSLSNDQILFIRKHMSNASPPIFYTIPHGFWLLLLIAIYSFVTKGSRNSSSSSQERMLLRKMKKNKNYIEALSLLEERGVDKAIDYVISTEKITQDEAYKNLCLFPQFRIRVVESLVTGKPKTDYIEKVVIAMIVGLITYCVIDAFLQNFTHGSYVKYRYEKIFDEGNRLYAQKKYNEAIEQYQKSITAGEQSANPYYNIGLCYGGLKEYQKASDYYTLAIEKKKDYAKAYFNRGRMFLLMGETEKAIADCDQAVTFDEKLDSAYFLRGFLYLNKESYALALADFKKTISLNHRQVDKVKPYIEQAREGLKKK